jgi:NAD(P)-dependent dehydrogenase (short-subunit alcohol dehydrogenase family)
LDKRIRDSGIDTNKVTIVEADITNFAKLSDAMQKVLTSRRVTGLVNNAAINPKVESGLGLYGGWNGSSWEDWSLELQVGIYGAYNCIRLLVPHMLEHGEPASIVNISSDYGHLAPNQTLYFDGTNNPPIKPLTYSLVKHAVVGLTRYFSTFWPGKNLRFNALAPGGVQNGQPSEFVERLSNQIPLSRMATVPEIASSLVFLLSGSSSYVNGIELVVDGGRNTW